MLMLREQNEYTYQKKKNVVVGQKGITVIKFKNGLRRLLLLQLNVGLMLTIIAYSAAIGVS